MPNWVSTTLTVSGPSDQIAEFKKKAMGKPIEGGGKASCLTFESFIPMPESLHVTQSTVGDLGYAVYHGQNIGPYLDWPEVRAAGVKDREGLALFLDVTQPEARSLGAIYAKNLELYGHTSWYEWSVDNWGTKWDAGSADLYLESDVELCYSFDTAWSPAEPVVQAMSEQFPGLLFVATFDEESHEFYYEAHWVGGDRCHEEELTRDSEDSDDEDDDGWDDEFTGESDGLYGPSPEVLPGESSSEGSEKPESGSTT